MYKFDGRGSSFSYQAPGSVSSGSMRMPGSSESPLAGGSGGLPWSDPDDHLVAPDTRQEVVHGQVVEASPARPGHGDTHCRLDAAVRLCTRDGYVASTDLLTRRAEDSDFATDTCVRKAGTVQRGDTESRHLEELSFEVFHTESRSHACERARDVMASGVRRMFGLFVDPVSLAREAAGEVAVTVEEWSVEHDGWVPVDPVGAIEDPCLASPLPVAALVDATALDDAVARMLVARRNRVIEALVTSSRDEGFGDGFDQGVRASKIAGIFAVLEHRGIALTREQRATIATCDSVARLDDWFARALSLDSSGRLFVS